MRAVLLAAFASVGLVGCLANLDPGTEGGDDEPQSAARVLYENNVHPIMTAKCMSCHMAGAPVGNITDFVTPTLSYAYATMVRYRAVVGEWTTATAPVLLKIQNGHPPGSTPIVYTTDETDKITAWLNQEIIDRNGAAPTGPESAATASQRLLSEWSGCMTQANFDTANMALGWGAMQAQNNQRCEACHAGGEQGFIATVDKVKFFTVISTNKYYMLQYFAVTGLDNPATATIGMNTATFTSVSGGLIPHRDHPRFDPTDNQGMLALTNFYNLTAAAVTAGGCGPSQLTN